MIILIKTIIDTYSNFNDDDMTIKKERYNDIKNNIKRRKRSIKLKISI